jgi:uncharacterized protein YbcV (DUF1398 family)
MLLTDVSGKTGRRKLKRYNMYTLAGNTSIVSSNFVAAGWTPVFGIFRAYPLSPTITAVASSETSTTTRTHSSIAMDRLRYFERSGYQINANDWQVSEKVNILPVNPTLFSQTIYFEGELPNGLVLSPYYVAESNEPVILNFKEYSAPLEIVGTSTSISSADEAEFKEGYFNYENYWINDTSVTVYYTFDGHITLSRTIPVDGVKTGLKFAAVWEAGQIVIKVLRGEATSQIIQGEFHEYPKAGEQNGKMYFVHSYYEQPS